MIMHTFADWGNTGQNMAESIGNTTVSTTKAHGRNIIYSVGTIWYFLLCGRAPSGSDMREYLEKSNSQITPTDIDIIMRCLSSSIENRYSSCEELLPIVKNAAMG